MVTLKDVAERAGVSIATVSYCINEKNNIKPETKLKVKQAIEDLNYIPNYSARNLKNTVSDEIGVILPNLEDSINSEILKGIIYQANLSHYSVNIACSYNNPHDEQTIINKFISKNYAGIILMTCQSQNTDFFMKTLFQHNISNVFIMRLPVNTSANFLGFDNYSTIFKLTESLINREYTDIALITGSQDFFSESECVSGYMEAHDKYLVPARNENLLFTDMSKEGAFKVTMLYLSSHIPQAIITSSQTIMEGVLEACNIFNIDPATSVCLITLAEERWNESCYHKDVIHTAETANTLGEDSFKILMEENTSLQLYDRKFKLYKDKILDTKIFIKPPSFQSFKSGITNTITLHIAAIELPTICAIKAVSQKFSVQSNIEFKFDFYPLRELFKVIQEDSIQEHPKYDIYLSDVSWMSYFLASDAFQDITEIMERIPGLSDAIFAKNLSNAQRENKYYGFPVIGGAQFLFYRKDLFNNPTLQKQYKDSHHISLRPPKTWAEFNRIARFFTKELNPTSPTQYGTSISSNLPEDLMTEILARLWSYGGGFYNSRNMLELNTPQNVRAFENLLETTQYTPPYETSNETTFEQMGKGDIAMAISFTEYASIIQNSLHPEFLYKLGYSMLPGHTPVNVGWHFCVSKGTSNLNAIELFFSWICKRQVSYYETILCGQSTMVYPHKHHELLRLYPWLELTESSQICCRDRFYPLKGKNDLIVPAEFESHFRDAFLKILHKNVPIPKALDQCQLAISKQFFS
ncbi:MAG: extracellular solute-binding protein [Lachnospiraceae bacterium]